MEKVSWLGIFALVTFIVAASVCQPELITNNGFMRALVSPEAINIAVVMVTVSLPVAYQVMRLISNNKAEIRAKSGFNQSEIEDICASLDEVISKVRLNSTLMVIYFFILLLSVLVTGGLPDTLPTLKAFVMGASLYLLVHMTLFMVELYYALNSWRGMDDIS